MVCRPSVVHVLKIILFHDQVCSAALPYIARILLLSS